MIKLSYLKHTLQTALPLTSASMVNAINGFFVMLMLAHLGKTTLAASALINTLMGLVVVPAIGFLSAVSVLTGYNVGADQHEKVSNKFQQGLVLSLILTIIADTFLAFIEPILLACGQPQAIANVVGSFFSWYLIVPPILYSMMCLRMFLAALNHRRIIFVFSLTNLCVTTSLAYFFTFVLHMGVHGTVLGMICGTFAVLLVNLLYISLNKKIRGYFLFRLNFTEGLQPLFRMLKLGWPMAVSGGSDLLTNLIFTIMVGWFGITALGAQQITMQLMLFVIIFVISLSQAGGILVSQAKGRKDHTAIQQYQRCALLIAWVVSLLVLFVFMLWHLPLIGIFINIHAGYEQSLIKLASTWLVLSACNQLFDSLTDITTGSLRGLFDTQFPMFINVFGRFFCFLPLVYFVGFPLKQGLIGMIITGISINALFAFILWRRWQFKYQQTRKNLLSSIKS